LFALPPRSSAQRANKNRKANLAVVEWLQRGKQTARTPGEAPELPDQDAIGLPGSRRSNNGDRMPISVAAGVSGFERGCDL
jgi:hypothetical protein